MDFKTIIASKKKITYLRLSANTGLWDAVIRWENELYIKTKTKQKTLKEMNAECYCACDHH